MLIGLLEDNPSIVEMLVTAFEMEGHTAEVHLNGLSLLHRLAPAAPFPYDVLIVDLGLPGGISGMDILAHLEQTFPQDFTSIFVLSGTDLNELERVRLRFPKMEILRKPIRLAALFQALLASGRSS